MPAPEEIEAMLMARLMPPALSQGTQEALEAMFDEALPEPSRRIPWMMPTAVAAALALTAGGLWMNHLKSAPSVSAFKPDASPALVLVGESDRIEEVTDEGWLDGADGSATHIVRFQVMEEESLRDEQTGIIVQISQPREEVFQMPVTTF